MYYENNIKVQQKKTLYNKKKTQKTNKQTNKQNPNDSL